MDDIDWTEEPMAELLLPLGKYDFERRIEPTYRNMVTGDTGPLDELCRKPGAHWHAFWCNRMCTRLSDGTVFQEPAKGAQRTASEQPGSSRPAIMRPTEALAGNQA